MSAPIPQAAFRDGTQEGAKVKRVCMCPHCGYNFEADGPIRLDGWMLWPTYSERLGKDARLTRAESGVLYTLAKAGGDWVTTEAIANRVSDSERQNAASCLVARIRKKLGNLSPIDSERGQRARGYRWRAAA